MWTQRGGWSHGKKLTGRERFAYRLCLALGRWAHPDFMFQDMTEKQFRGWQSYYEVEPWGEERADWRTEVFQMRMMHRLFPKGAAKPPDAIWPYFPEMPTPAELKAAGEKFDDAIEPKPGGGYRWKPGREPKLDGNDNR